MAVAADSDDEIMAAPRYGDDDGSQSMGAIQTQNTWSSPVPVALADAASVSRMKSMPAVQIRNLSCSISLFDKTLESCLLGLL